MIDPEAPSPRDAEMSDFMAWLVPQVWALAVDGDPIEGPGEIAEDAEWWVYRYRYHVRNLAGPVPLVGGPFGGMIVQVARGEPSPWYEIRQAGQRHHYTLTPLHCGHWEYRYREDAPPKEEL